MMTGIHDQCDDDQCDDDQIMLASGDYNRVWRIIIARN